MDSEYQARLQKRSLSLLLLVLHHLGSNSIHVGHTLGSKRLSSESGGTFLGLILDLASEAVLLKLLVAVSDDLSSGLSLVRLESSVSLLATIVLAEAGHIDFLSHVHLVSEGGSPGVEPVGVVGRQLLEAGSLGVC